MKQFAKLFEVYDKNTTVKHQILIWYEFDSDYEVYLLRFHFEMDDARVEAKWKFNNEEIVQDALAFFDQQKVEDYFYSFKP